MSIRIILQQVRESFRAIYQKIERQKLNKMSYLKYYISSIQWGYIIKHEWKRPQFTSLHVRFLTVYLLPFFEIEKPHAEFLICYVTFDSLQNCKKISKKKVGVRGKTGLTSLSYIVIFHHFSIENEHFQQFSLS